MKEDNVILTLTFERNINGTVTRKVSISGNGFHFFEIIGLMQMCCYEFADKSKKTAAELPEGKPVNIVFDSQPLPE